MAEVDAKDILAVLKKAALDIRGFEAAANAALYEQGDRTAHARNLVAKAELLTNLPALAAKALEDLQPSLRVRVSASLQGFAQRGRNALNVNSVFYMAQLLYPDDYRDGEPNDLEAYVEDLAEMLA